jgi:hypothetical protein
MLKHLKYFIAIIALLVSVQPAFAFDTKSIVKLDAPYATLYRGTFDNVVLDFSVLTTNQDTLKAVSLKNLGTAENINQILQMTLWADSGPVGFQGWGVDHQLGYFSYYGAMQNWYLENLNERITDSQRFFVTVELFSFISKSATIQMQIPKLVDSNGNGSYNLTDLGIFMDSGNNGPSDTAITNSNTQVISTTTTDTWKPKIIIANLFANQAINNTYFTISGTARDQGNSGIYDLKIFIDNQEFPMTRAYMENWEYDWQNITDGTHTIKVGCRDALYNSSLTEEITVSVTNQVLSLANSSSTIDRLLVRNDGLDKAVVTVKLIDINQKAIANRQVNMESSDVIAIPSNYKITDQAGQAIFEVRSTVVGPKILTFNTDGQVLATFNLNVNLSGADINSGDLVKASTPAVYYFGANGKRYVFSSLDIYYSWYSDFKNVKTITDSQLASLPMGGNVTFKPGMKLIKIASDPKVYAIDLSGTLRWIKTEAVAKSLYGSTWATKIVDVSVANFGDYKLGADIATAGDFDLAKAKAVAGINEDKGL